MLTNAELLARLDSAFKAISVGDLNEGILVPEQFDRFVQVVQHRTTILQEARFIRMESHQHNIDRVGFTGRILRSGLASNKTTHRDLGTDEHVAPTFQTNKLIAQELQAITGIKDQALRRNLEKANFESTLVDLFGEAAGRDLEEYTLLADKSFSYADDAVLSLTDGWVKRAANKVYGSGSDKDFDPAANTWPENMFEALLKAVPKQYLQNITEWRFYVDWEVQNDYRNLLKARGTQLGDQAITTAMGLVYKGIPVVYVPMLERSAAVGTAGAGDVAMLQHPDNMVWGLFHEITIERDRIPKSRQTDFVLTLEADADYEDENGAVVALIDQETPGS